MTTPKDRPGTRGKETRGTTTRDPAPAPVDKSEESIAGEEDPGASMDETEEPAFNRLPPKTPPGGRTGG